MMTAAENVQVTQSISGNYVDFDVRRDALSESFNTATGIGWAESSVTLCMRKSAVA